jgi:peptide/nickel transport system permease protein
MMGYFAHRLAHGILLVVGVSLLSFLFLGLAPGNFLDEMRLNPEIAPETVTALRTQYGLNQPLPRRYLRWLKSVCEGDLGFSFAYNSPVASLLWPRACNTLFLTVTATVVAWLIALPLGMWSAVRRGGWGERLFMGTISGLLAIPDILLALALLYLAVRTGWFPAGGMVSVGFTGLGWWGKVKDIASHCFLPVAALVAGNLPVLVRHVRAGAVEALASPFIRTARAHGLPTGSLLFRYALRAAANPLASLAGFTLAGLVSGSLLTEVIMSWPGVGPLLLEALLARDVYVVIGAVMFSTVFIFLGNLFADGLLYALDPRIRRE